jgi:hypothetical protein
MKTITEILHEIGQKALRGLGHRAKEKGTEGVKRD